MWRSRKAWGSRYAAGAPKAQRDLTLPEQCTLLCTCTVCLYRMDRRHHCTVQALHCTALYCTVQYCTVLGIALYRSVLSSMAQNVRSADWTEYVTPFWPAVIATALTFRGFLGLLKAGEWQGPAGVESCISRACQRLNA